jgi:hypothetical protein
MPIIAAVIALTWAFALREIARTTRRNRTRDALAIVHAHAELAADQRRARIAHARPAIRPAGIAR